MSEDETRKIVWEVLTEFEKVKGQLQETFYEKEAELKKQETEQIVDAMTQLAQRDEQIVEALKTTTTLTTQRLHELSEVTIKMMESSNKSDEVLVGAFAKLADAINGIRTRLDDVEKLIIARLGKEKA